MQWCCPADNMSAAGSLASATSTRVDSASKHIQACRVNEEYMMHLLEVGSDPPHPTTCATQTDEQPPSIPTSQGYTDNPNAELQNNKMKYCMHKDEVVIGLGRPRYGVSRLMGLYSKKAYPSVITNLARMQDHAKRIMVLHNFIVTGPNDADSYKNIGELIGCQMLQGDPNAMQIMQELFRHVDSDVAAAEEEAEAEAAAGRPRPLVPTPGQVQQKIVALHAAVDNNKRNTIKEQVINMPDLHFVGISLGLAYAHHNSGDTVASVMIGGLRTVQNGAFPIHTNDQLMWYIDEEQDFFEQSGARIDRSKWKIGEQADFIANGTIPAAAAAQKNTILKETMRKAYYDRGNGNFHGTTANMKANVFRIKPYIVSRHSEVDGRIQHFPCDKARIWGRAISNAQPWEMVDVQISRQAI